jgi:hypothetical protein
MKRTLALAKLLLLVAFLYCLFTWTTVMVVVIGVATLAAMVIATAAVIWLTSDSYIYSHGDYKSRELYRALEEINQGGDPQECLRLYSYMTQA